MSNTEQYNTTIHMRNLRRCENHYTTYGQVDHENMIHQAIQHMERLQRRINDLELEKIEREAKEYN